MAPQLELGIVLPTAGPPGAALPELADAARLAEAVGLDSVWAGDHLVLDGVPLLDATLALAAAAAVTRRVAIGFAVLVPALRPRAWAAKQIATLQLLTGPARLRLGIAAGAGGELEWAAAGVPRTERGRRTDAFLRDLPALLGGRPTRLEELPGAPEIALSPGVPVPPIWIGGASDAALARAAAYGDTWLSALQTAGEVDASRRRVAALAAARGRRAPATAAVIHVTLGTQPGRDLRRTSAATLRATYGMPEDRARALAIGGTPGEVAEQLSAFAAGGAEHLVVLPDGPWPEACELAAQVRAALQAPAGSD
jgi:alkanesulfonate monooxygenase SsuD/methylene tetrahydromethanopterin reductase-like flavin-dependent oxidoreductase (luciferase family)